MIDLRTLLLLLAIVDLMFAAALWLGAGRRMPGGLGAWILSLVARATACGLLLAAGPAEGALALGSGLFALSIALQASALLAFDHRRLDPWLYGALVAAIAIPMQLLERDPPEAALFGGLLVGTFLAGAAAVTAQLRAFTHSSVRAVLCASYLIAAIAFALRGLAAVLTVDGVQAFRTPAGVAAAEWFAVFAASLATTLAYVLLLKERSDAEVERLSLLDPLTKAYNRRTFHEAAERELARARRAGQPLSMVLVDIDHFGSINEKYGHLVGDEVLAEFAALMRDVLRQEDMLVRFGGEEFLVLLPDVPGPGAVVVAGRLRRRIEETNLRAAGRDFNLTVSIGVAARLDEGPESMESLIDRATAALDLAKERGRNRVVALSLGRSIAA